MSSIKPFHAVYYNPEKIEDLNKVVSPPYDIISQEEQIQYHNLSPYNFTHIDLGRDKARDDKKNNKYTRAKKMFHEWIKKGIMVQDEKPCIYFYRQEYKMLGEKHHRLGFISLMKLQDDEDSKVHPHEDTHAKVIEDRLKLTRALSSNLSSIFVCYSDKQRQVEKIFNRKVVTNDPIIDIVDENKVKHRLWRLDDKTLIKEINDSISGQNLFIADGHHRYQVALQYRRRKLQRKTNVSMAEPFNYVMTYFTNLDSKDLQILPMHRIVKRINKKMDFLEEFFRIDKVRNGYELPILLAKAGINEHAFGLYTRDGIKLLRLKNKLLINKHIKEGSSDFKNLDATILKHFVLDRLGIESDDIKYTKDYKEATDLVDHYSAQASFIMNPVRIEQLKAIALNGERMPAKTTYFYPKVLSGLTVYKMD